MYYLNDHVRIAAHHQLHGRTGVIIEIPHEDTGLDVLKYRVRMIADGRMYEFFEDEIIPMDDDDRDAYV